MVPAGVGASPNIVLGQHGTGLGRINYPQPPPATMFRGRLMAAAAEGFMQGTAQRVAQCLQQNMTGSDSGAGTRGSTDTGDTFPIFDIL
ncbi:hypothetical protein CDL15_Pgr005370 [Punica granatum]|uniref:Uncharacterized protein n=1 Tax=Punica granatum TaxID=22663 RepID=A0A218XE05_PUNGR|nr:hypothetical protein CDL15_Pgr005370 [Punica granatum]